ncbi:MAG: hypothetical protein JJT94_06060 [Bernardetiaceae bacterium]|nr:hypothetical protein [Bernardetiaceae bacterium]
MLFYSVDKVGSSLRYKNLVFCKVNASTLKIEGEHKELDEVDYYYDFPDAKHFEIIPASPDGRKIATILTAANRKLKDHSYKVSVLENTGKVLWQTEDKYSEKKGFPGYIKYGNPLINDKSDIFVPLYLEKYTNYIHVLRKGKDLEEIVIDMNIEDKKHKIFTPTRIVFDKEQKYLYCLTFFEEGKRKNSKQGYVFCKINTQTLKIEQQAKHYLEASPFLKDWTCQITHLQILEDGSLIGHAESFYRGYKELNPNSTVSTNSVPIAEFKDSFFFRLDTNGKLIWDTIIEKSQVIIGDRLDIAHGSVSLITTDTHAYAFMNSNRRCCNVSLPPH